MKISWLAFLRKVEQMAKEYELTTGFGAIAQFILQNKYNDQIWNQKLSIFDLASLTNTSSPSITRFAQKVGLSGFKELLMLMKQNLKEQTNLELYRNELLEVDNEMLLEQTIMAVKGVYQNLIPFDQIKIKGFYRKRIFFFGTKNNALIIKMMLPIFKEHGYEVVFHNSPKVQWENIKSLEREDFIVLLSLDLTEKFLANLFRKINKLRSTTFVITKKFQDYHFKNRKNFQVLRVSDQEETFFKFAGNEVNMVFYLKVVTNKIFDLGLLK